MGRPMPHVQFALLTDKWLMESMFSAKDGFDDEQRLSCCNGGGDSAEEARRARVPSTSAA